MKHAWCPEGWAKNDFAHGDHAHPFYVIDRRPVRQLRPSILLMHEFPGISNDLVALADRLAAEFRVVVPSVFGRDGDPACLDTLRQICVRREIHAFARDGVSRSVGWLRDLADTHVADATEPLLVSSGCASPATLPWHSPSTLA